LLQLFVYILPKLLVRPIYLADSNTNNRLE